MTRPGYVDIMASRRNGTLYLGVTSNLPQRVYQHRQGQADGFSNRYGCRMLVWFAAFDDIQDARASKLQMKKWKRSWKLQAIEAMNPNGATCSRRLRCDWVPAFAGTRLRIEYGRN